MLQGRNTISTQLLSVLADRAVKKGTEAESLDGQFTQFNTEQRERNR